MQGLLINNVKVLNGKGMVRGTSLWCDGGKIRAINPNPPPGGVKRLDAEGGYLIPALEDAHFHLLQYGTQLERIDLSNYSSKQEALNQLAAEKLHRSGEWVLGGEWDVNIWDEPSFPNRFDLDLMVPEQPCAIYSKDLHVLWVNSVAVARMGITRETHEPQGGFIQRDEHGEPTGILFDQAMNMVNPVLPVLTMIDVNRIMARVESKLFAFGIVGVHTNETIADYRMLENLRRNHRLALRVTFNPPGQSLNELQELGFYSGYGDAGLLIGGLKWFADGTLGSRSASMLKPFCESGGVGRELLSEKELVAVLRKGMAAGFYSVVHAIGDKANKNLLKALVKVSSQSQVLSLHHRVEHAQLIDPEDFQHVAQVPAVFSMQPLQAMSDVELIKKYWGEERGRWAYPFRSLLSHGAKLTFGSDAPVADPNPWKAMAVVTSGYGGNLYGDEQIGREQAIAAYTSGAALASGLDKIRGRIAPGMDADLAIIPQNPYDPEVELQHVRPNFTIRKGRVVFAK